MIRTPHHPPAQHHAATATAARPPTLGEELERHRLAIRIRRVEGAVAVLRLRAEEARRESGRVPGPLGLAIENLEQRAQAMRTRIRQLSA